MTRIKIKLRFDYAGRSKPGKLFANKNLEQLADEVRQQKVAVLRNVPIQGIHIEDIDMSQDIYSLVDDITGKRVVYAPVLITFFADSIEEAVKFVIKEEFRTVEIIEPGELLLVKHDIEKFLYRISQEMDEYRKILDRKIEN